MVGFETGGVLAPFENSRRRGFVSEIIGISGPRHSYDLKGVR